MTQRQRKQDPLGEINRSQQEEIIKYKWIESEKAGKDIGWERARQEWLDKHFPAWKDARWQSVISDAVKAETLLN